MYYRIKKAAIRDSETSTFQKIISAPDRALGKLVLFDRNVAVRGPNKITETTRKAVKQMVKDSPKMKETDIVIGNSPVISQIKRTWQGKGHAWNQPIIRHALAPLQGITGIAGKVMGGDYYNPISGTISVRSNIPAIAAHEIGHAADFSNIKFPSLYTTARLIPGVDIYQEHKASQIAGKKLKHGRETLPILTPAMGTYVGNLVFPGVGAIAGAMAGHAVKSNLNYGEYGNLPEKTKNKIKKGSN